MCRNKHDVEEWGDGTASTFDEIGEHDVGTYILNYIFMCPKLKKIQTYIQTDIFTYKISADYNKIPNN